MESRQHTIIRLISGKCVRNETINRILISARLAELPDFSPQRSDTKSPNSWQLAAVKFRCMRRLLLANLSADAMSSSTARIWKIELHEWHFSLIKIVEDFQRSDPFAAQLFAQLLWGAAAVVWLNFFLYFMNEAKQSEASSESHKQAQNWAINDVDSTFVIINLCPFSPRSLWSRFQSNDSSFV